MSGALVPYNISLPAASGPWVYTPFRDGPAATGWNASYTGNETWPYWQTEANTGAGNLFFRTQFETSKIALEFTGIGIVLCATANGATYTLTVDGRVVRTTGTQNDPACADYGSTSTMVANGLDFGRHTAEINVVSTSEDNEFQFFGGLVTTNVAVGSASEKASERMIDDAAPEWFMVPGRGRQQWDISVHDNDYQKSSSFICFYRPNATASYTFKGASAVIMYSHIYRDTHNYAVILDDRTINLDVSTSGWDVGMTPVFLESNLDPDTSHTITIRNYNDDNANCSGPTIKDFRSCCASIDALQLIGSEASLSSGLTTTSTPASSTDPAPSSSATQGGSTVQQEPRPSGQQRANSSSTSPGAIAGGVLGGILGALVIALAAFCLIRRHRRNQGDSYADSARQVNLHTGDIDGSSVRPYLPPPASSAYSTTSGGYAQTPMSDRKGDPFATGAVSAGHGRQNSLPGGSLATPPHPSNEKGRRIVHPAPVSHTSTTSAGSGGGALPLGQEDMTRVLHYVSEQMSQRGASRAADSLPSYQR